MSVNVNFSFPLPGPGETRTLKALVHRQLADGSIACSAPNPILTTAVPRMVTCPSCKIPGQHERRVVVA